MAKEKKQNEEIEEIDVGDELFSWETWEFPPYERSRTWYLVAGLIGLALIVYAFYSSNYLFAIIVLMMGIIILINHLRKPERIRIYITTLGVVIGDEFYRFREISDFSIVYDPPDVQLLYLDFHSLTHPVVALSLEDSDPNEVREALLPFVFENLDREEESLTDTLRRVYKL